MSKNLLSLSDAETMNGAESLYLVQNGGDRKVSARNLAGYMGLMDGAFFDTWGGDSVGTTPLRLTKNGLAADLANTLNIRDLSARSLDIVIIGRNASNSVIYVYRCMDALLYRGSGASSVLYVAGTVTTKAVGSTAGVSASIVADTIKGGLSVIVTGPGLNWTAAIKSTEAI